MDRKLTRNDVRKIETIIGKLEGWQVRAPDGWDRVAEDAKTRLFELRDAIEDAIERQAAKS